MRWEYKGEKHKAATFFDSMEIHNGMSSASSVVVTFKADRPLIFGFRHQVYPFQENQGEDQHPL